MNSQLKLVLLICAFPLAFSGCKVYSFTGASIAPSIKSVTVENFYNQSQSGNVSVSQDFTDQLKNKLLRETNLGLTDRNGDVEFKGAITGYTIQSQAPTADQSTAINRLTITAKVEYINHVNESESWTRNFSFYGDYPNTVNLSEVEDELVQDINAQLVEDIFNAAFSNW